MADALSAWQPICDRLTSQVPGLKVVKPTWELASVVEQSQVVPAAYVVFDGADPREQAGHGKKVLEGQRFIVVLAVRNARDVLGGSGAAADASPLLAAIAAALSGWKPTPAHGELMRVAGAPRPHYTPGFAYIALLFETRSFFP